MFQWCQITKICQTFLVVFVAYSQGRIQKGRIKDMHILPPAIFKNVFDVCDSSIVSNLFDSDKPYALSTPTLSTHNRKCANKMNHVSLSTQN